MPGEGEDVIGAPRLIQRMLLADAELEGQPVGDVLAALADQLGGAEQDLLTLVTGQLRLVGGCDFKGARACSAVPAGTVPITSLV